MGLRGSQSCQRSSSHLESYQEKPNILNPIIFQSIILYQSGLLAQSILLYKTIYLYTLISSEVALD